MEYCTKYVTDGEHGGEHAVFQRVDYRTKYDRDLCELIMVLNMLPMASMVESMQYSRERIILQNMTETSVSGLSY